MDPMLNLNTNAPTLFEMPSLRPLLHDLHVTYQPRRKTNKTTTYELCSSRREIGLLCRRLHHFEAFCHQLGDILVLVL